MKSLFSLLSLSLLFSTSVVAHTDDCDHDHADGAKPAATPDVVLDENIVANLRLEYARAEGRLFEETTFAIGRVEARPGAAASLTARIPGRIVALDVAPGDTVAAGDTPVRVESRQAGDPPPIIALRAPIAGTVTTLPVRLGDPVEPSAPILEITDLTEVHAVARVPESAVGKLRVGETVARIRLAAFPGEIFEGKLERLAPAADAASGTLEARFRLPNSDGRLRPGLRAEFSIVLATRPVAVAVPVEAVQGEGTSPRVVFTRAVGLPHAFIKTPVVLGARNDRHVEILSGLEAGGEVVARGSYPLLFVGGGGLSLKEALDAAHGHEHAEDGSELSSGGASTGHDHDHGDGHDHEDGHAHAERPWQIATGALALLALILGIRLARKPAARKA